MLLYQNCLSLEVIRWKDQSMKLKNYILVGYRIDSYNDFDRFLGSQRMLIEKSKFTFSGMTMIASFISCGNLSLSPVFSSLEHLKNKLRMQARILAR